MYGSGVAGLGFRFEAFDQELSDEEDYKVMQIHQETYPAASVQCWIRALAGERGDWHQARHVYSTYSGAEIQVFNAAMHAAIRCDQYKQGALIYQKLCSLNINRTAPAFTSALTIHSMLGKKDAVREIWKDAMRECELDAALAAARISAAAAEGDVQTAATVLDQMNVSGMAINVGHLSAAIRACWEAEGSHHNAAKYLFNLHKELDLQPNVITFACLVGSYISAPLEEIRVAYTEMKELGIVPNTVFAESYLVTVLRKPKGAPWDEDEMLVALHERSPERIAAARQAIDDFKAEGDSNFESPSKDMSSIEATSPIEQASSYKLHPAAAAQQAAKEEDHYDYEQPALSEDPELPETQDIGQPQEAEEPPAAAAADADVAASSESRAQPAEEETYDMPAADKLSEVCKDLRAEAEKTDAAASATGAQPSDLDYRTPDMYLNPQGPEAPSGQASRQTSRDLQPVRRQWVQTQPQLPSAAAAAAAAATAVRQTSPDMKTSPELPVSVSRQDSAYSASGYSQSNSPSVPYRHFSGRILTPRESSGNISVVSNGRPGNFSPRTAFIAAGQPPASIPVSQPPGFVASQPQVQPGVVFAAWPAGSTQVQDAAPQVASVAYSVTLAVLVDHLRSHSESMISRTCQLFEAPLQVSRAASAEPSRSRLARPPGAATGQQVHPSAAAGDNTDSISSAATTSSRYAVFPARNVAGPYHATGPPLRRCGGTWSPVGRTPPLPIIGKSVAVATDAAELQKHILSCVGTVIGRLTTYRREK
ncbi:FCA [Symbiodinium microadriaticum]|nr:FCA [Symbiodinium microadriaticum]